MAGQQTATQLAQRAGTVTGVMEHLDSETTVHVAGRFDGAAMGGCTMDRIDFERLVVRTCGDWIWQLHENQSYLGRMVLRLIRHEEGSLVHCTDREWLTLRQNLRDYERILDDLFEPDRYNYGQLGNVYHQMHVHAVPRYMEARTLLGITFVDTMWGQNWASAAQSPLSLEQTYTVADWLRARIEHV